MNTALTITIIIVTILLGITYHEYGHMKSAIKRGIRVDFYQLGFGPVVYKRKLKNGIEFRLAILPFGGACGIPDKELNDASLKNFTNVLLAGIGRNAILGIILCFIGTTILFGMENLLTAFTSTISVSATFLTTIPEMIEQFFNVKEIAEVGGVVSQFSYAGTTLSESLTETNHLIGMSFIIGGVMNYALAVFNALPIPALDGGQVVMRLICEGTKKFLNKEIPGKIIQGINITFFGLLLIYQFLIFSLDIPFVRNLFL